MVTRLQGGAGGTKFYELLLGTQLLFLGALSRRSRLLSQVRALNLSLNLLLDHLHF